MTDIDMILLSGRAAPGLPWPSRPRQPNTSSEPRTDAKQPLTEPSVGGRCSTCGGPVREDEMEGGEQFQLTPLGETDDEEKDSSQIIALDDIAEEETAGVVFQPADDTGGLGDDFGTAGLTPGMATVAVPAEDVAISAVGVELDQL